MKGVFPSQAQLRIAYWQMMLGEAEGEEEEGSQAICYEDLNSQEEEGEEEGFRQNRQHRLLLSSLAT